MKHLRESTHFSGHSKLYFDSLIGPGDKIRIAVGGIKEACGSCSSVQDEHFANFGSGWSTRSNYISKAGLRARDDSLVVNLY